MLQVTARQGTKPNLRPQSQLSRLHLGVVGESRRAEEPQVTGSLPLDFSADDPALGKSGAGVTSRDRVPGRTTVPTRTRSEAPAGDYSTRLRPGTDVSHRSPNSRIGPSQESTSSTPEIQLELFRARFSDESAADSSQPDFGHGSRLPTATLPNSVLSDPFDLQDIGGERSLLCALVVLAVLAALWWVI